MCEGVDLLVRKDKRFVNRPFDDMAKERREEREKKKVREKERRKCERLSDVNSKCFQDIKDQISRI